MLDFPVGSFVKRFSDEIGRMNSRISNVFLLPDVFPGKEIFPGDLDNGVFKTRGSAQITRILICRYPSLTSN